MSIRAQKHLKNSETRPPSGVISETLSSESPAKRPYRIAVRIFRRALRRGPSIAVIASAIRQEREEQVLLRQDHEFGWYFMGKLEIYPIPAAAVNRTVYDRQMEL